ncbi:MAG: DUF507 family protein [Candidatus Tectomicrobia bacterium]|uniref:DUF507 family protein n=1 Tax=Tectimicrobiota bacterium TaxID=2528274 RepID=A0A932LZL3_UNCTE|nr:DUF507 family protein [Candidatus Tectomicrobia bacterium]
MRLSREKINHLSKLLIGSIQGQKRITLTREANDVRLRVVKVITDELKIDDVIDAEVRRSLNSYSKKPVEGSREWDILYQKLYESEMKKRRGF